MGLGRLHELENANRCPQWSWDGQDQVREDFGNHRGGRDEGQGAAALWTGGDVDGKHSFE